MQLRQRRRPRLRRSPISISRLPKPKELYLLWKGLRLWDLSCRRGIQEWTGALVCAKCLEPRHEQTLIKVTGEQAFPDIVSKDSNTYTQTCDAYSILSMADFGTADCMIVGTESTFDPYQFRYSSVAAWAIAGVAIAGMP